MLQELRTLLAFSRRPVRTWKKQESTSDAIKAVLALMAALFIFEVLVFIPLLYVKHYYTDVVSAYAGETILFSFITGVLIAPVIEELISRAGLRKSAYLLLFGMPLLTCVLGHFQVGVGLGAILLSIAAYGEVNKKPGVAFRRGRAVIRHYRILFWMFASAFGIFHFDSYSLGGFNSLIVPVLLISPIMAGFMLGYLRIRYGLAAAIALHVLNNLMAFTFMHGLKVPY